MPPSDDVVIAVPADPSYATLLRSVAASMAARIDLPVDDLEDLRLAVDEAFACLLAAATGATSVTMRVAPRIEGLEAFLTCDGDAATWPPASDDLARQVLTALADEVRFDRADGRPAVAIGKRAARG